MKTNKVYVLDTNVIVLDPNSIFSFKEHDVIIPLVVIEELDNHKNRQDEVGKNVRQFTRMLDDMRRSGNLFEGINLPQGGILRVQSSNKKALEQLPVELQNAKVDNLIIAFMLSLETERVVGSRRPVLVTKDVNVRIKCDSLGVPCQDYLKMRVTDDRDKLYRGVEVMTVDESLIQALFSNEAVMSDQHRGDTTLYPNQVLVLKGKERQTSALARYVNGHEPMVPIKNVDDVFGLKPKNKEQVFSLHLLLEPDIKLVSLTGPAGVGKTCLALAAALHQLKTFGPAGIYDKIIVTRPIQPIGKDIGFLPGTLEEKMDPWIAPIRDNLEFLMGSNKEKRKKGVLSHEPYLSLLQNKGLIEIEAITYIRGRSIPNAFIIIDEAQNVSQHEIKTILTRVGNDSKICLLGDPTQIDNFHVDVFTNGLTYVIEKFKEHAIAGHVSLIKGERSPLATLSADIL